MFVILHSMEILLAAFRERMLCDLYPSVASSKSGSMVTDLLRIYTTPIDR